MKFVIDKIVIPNEYKVYGLNDAPDKFPNISIEKDGKKYGLVIVPNKYPLFASVNDDFRKAFVKACEEHNTIPVYCPVLLHSIDKERAVKGVFLRGDVFNLKNVGQKILNGDDKQEITPNNLDFKL